MIIIREINEREEFQKGLDKIPKAQKCFLQSWEYGQLHQKIGNTPLYLGVYEENSEGKNSKGDSKTDLIQSLLCILFRAKRGSYIFCPYGVHDQEQLKVLIAFLKDYGRKNKIDFLRFSPLLEDTEENRILFKKNGFRYAPVHMMHPELLWLLDITKSEEEILGQMRKNTRYYVKRAEKDGVKIVVGATQELLDQFYEIHAETARRQKFIPYSKSYLDAQLAVFGPLDQIKIFIGMYQDKAIASAVIMYQGDQGVYHHGASLSEYNKIPASYLIQWEAIKEAKKRGFSTYNFWGVVDNAPKHPWAGLSFFKKGFGGEGKNILHAQDYPLTLKYWINWLVEIIRKMKRGY